VFLWLGFQHPKYSVSFHVTAKDYSSRGKKSLHRYRHDQGELMLQCLGLSCLQVVDIGPSSATRKLSVASESASILALGSTCIVAPVTRWWPRPFFCQKPEFRRRFTRFTALDPFPASPSVAAANLHVTTLCIASSAV
jgi:hypothetical protein